MKTTNLGNAIHETHPMAHAGHHYRFQNVSGWVHVDEWVASCSVWHYLGAYRA